MSLRLKVFNVLEVVLRVPPLFVIDEILKLGIGLQDFTEHDLSHLEQEATLDEVTEFANTTASIANQDIFFYKFILFSLLRLLLSALGCATALCIFILNTKQLIVVYMYLISVGVVLTSYWTNIGTVKAITTSNETNPCLNLLTNLATFNITEFFNENTLSFHLLQNIILQTILSFIFNNIHLGPRYKILQRVLPVTFFAPMILALALLPFDVPEHILSHLPVFAALLPYALVKFVLWSSVVSIIQTMYAGYQHARNFVSNFGMSALVETQWQRLNVPEVLRTFWLLRVVEHTAIFFMLGYWDDIDGHSPYFRLMKHLMITGCDTVAALLGITSIVSFICNYIGKMFQWILLTEDDNDKNFGTVAAIVFYILALQTGLTGLEPEVRFVRLCRNFCLLFTAILHFIHNVVNPLLMSLSASHNPSLRRHLHALLVCAVLVFLPILLMVYLWSTQELSTWLLAVTAFSVEVIVKVFVSLSIYALFLLDAHRETFWEKLDDYIYYIRAFGNTVEFCFGIFLFFNGAWILLFESGSAIRAVMMCIHAYFNIWCDAKAGWSVFIKRRTAVNKIESLPEAEEDQLRDLDDVCAICYQEMKSAKITKCKHFFHGVCLRKWLYVQDRCPLCHEILHGIDSEDKRGNEATPVIIADNNFDR